MDYLKTKAVLWKRELTREGEVWLEPTVQDAERTNNWQQN
jgi:molybdopterin synthase catalytic subunit